jgi:hypothetical protein
MKVQIHSKIIAIAAAALIGMAMTGSPVLARGGGGFGGGHIGGFGGAHIGVVGGPHLGSFGISHMVGGLGVQPGASGIAMDRSLDGHGLGHTHVSHELRNRHFRGLYGVSPLYDNTDCPWPADLTIESCPVGSVTE